MSRTGGRRHPGVERHLEERGRHAQARLVDAITASAGSVPFVDARATAFDRQ